MNGCGTMTNHLYRRAATYYWRSRLPRPIAIILGRSHYARSLRTTHPETARRLARAVSAMVEQVAQQIRSMSMVKKRQPTKDDLDRILLDLFTEILEVGELERAARPAGWSPWVIDTDITDEDDPSLDTAYPEYNAEEIRAALLYNELGMGEQCADEKLRERGFERPDGPHQWRGYVRKVLATIAAAEGLNAERERGVYHPPIHPFVSIGSGPALGLGGAGEESARQKLSEMFEANITSKKAEGKWKASGDTEQQARMALRLFLSYKGDLPFAQITKPDAFAFREWLCGLPCLVGKGIYKDMDYRAAVALRQSVEKALGKRGSREATDTITVGGLTMTRRDAEARAEKLSKTTVNKHLTFFTDAYNERIKKSGLALRNPFEGVLFAEKDLKKDASKRKPWPISELQALFNTPLFTGAAGHRPGKRARAGDFLADDGPFWLPLIGLFTGAREDEIASLALDDLQFDSDAECWIIDIKAGKTSNAPRKIPVHPELIKIGLVEYRQEVEKSGASDLFPEFHDQYRDAGGVFSRFFTKYRRDCGIYEKWKDFHALRHTLRTSLYRELQAHPVLVREMMGHAQIDEMDVVYFHGFEPKQSAPVVSALTFAPLDLSHLHKQNQPQRRFLAPKQAKNQGAQRTQSPPERKASIVASSKAESERQITHRKRVLTPAKHRKP
jgi:integrase